MQRRTLNLGILAHVDAGKTTLTERLLYDAGVIGVIGSVDRGTTQTDTLALERLRGITIKAAVVSFGIGDVTVNLIDTPGHPDFIAEVERVLAVLDGAVLVISAVEGVQAQSRLLMRALQRLRVPTLIFVNKIDRAGAATDRTLRAIAERLTPAVAPLASVRDIGTPRAAVVPGRGEDPEFVACLAAAVAERDDEILREYVEHDRVPFPRLRAALKTQTAAARLHPVLFGSALTGAGVDTLSAEIEELLQSSDGDGDDPVSGTVFKIDRGPAGERIAYVRLFAGSLHARDRVRVGGAVERKVTAISVFEGGRASTRGFVRAGEIAMLWGLGDIRIGDAVGALPPAASDRHFAPPSLETVVVPHRASERGRLRVTLAQLAEQDPLIDVRQDARGELSVTLYGEVQKEVIQATLAADYGLDVTFHETTTICIERPLGTGAAVERLREEPNPFLATVGLRIDPAAAGSGVAYRLQTEPGALPPAFHAAVEQTVREVLHEGLHGWEVTDCVVTMTHSGYLPRQSHAHQGFAKSMSSTAGDFRNLTPLVVMDALRRAGTIVHEPIHTFRLEVPATSVGAVVPTLARLRAVVREQSAEAAASVLAGDIPAAHVHTLRLELPGLTGGEGVLECAFERYEPVTGTPPAHARSDANPLNREEYLLRIARRFATAGFS